MSSEIIFSQSRSYQYTSPETMKSLVVYQVYTTLRDNKVARDEYLSKNTTDDYYREFYKLPENLFDLWIASAIAFYEKDYSALESFMFNCPFVVTSEPILTIWGHIVDRYGRYLSLTLTEQSSVDHIVRHLQNVDGFYDYQNNGRIDLNIFGENNYRYKTVVLNDEKSPKKSFVDDKIVCRTITELNNIPVNTSFTLLLSGYKKEAKSLRLYGFVQDLSRDLMAVDNDPVYGYFSQPANVKLFKQLEKTGSDRFSPDDNIWVNGVKVLSSSGNVMYERLKLSK
jgi:hypothetical protein